MRYDIQIEIHIHGRRDLIRSKEVLAIMDMIETAGYDSDRADIDIVSGRLDLPPLLKDACLERLRRFRHQRLLLREIGQGSLAVFGFIAGVSYFVVQKTIGESFSQGFKASKTHEELKEFFRGLVDDKALRFAEGLRRLISSRRRTGTTVKVLPPTDDTPNRIVIDAVPPADESDENQPASLGEMLD